MSSMRSLFILALLSAPGAVAAENEATQVSPQLRQRAEDLAGAASSRFSDLLDGGQRVAQATPQTPDTEISGGAFAPVWDWLARSAQAYDDLVITQLKEKDGWTVIVQRNEKASPPAVQVPAPAAGEEPQRELRGWSGLVEVVRDWLARANRSYRTEIVKPLLEPLPGAAPPSEIATQPPPPAPPAPMAPQSAPAVTAGAVKDDAVAERIKQEAQAADTNRAIDETEAKGKAEDERRLAEQAEAKRKADADAKRIADEAAQKRKIEEDKRLAAEAEAKRKADEEKRVADEAAAKRKANETERVATEAEAKRKAEAATRSAEAAAKRKADDAKREAEAADVAERRAVAQAETEAKRQADIDAEASRRSAAAARTKETARAEAPAPALATPPATVTSPDVTQRATTPSTPSVKAPMAAGASTSPANAASENSAVAEVPSAPEQKPKEPEPVREATPKAREEAVVAEVAPAAVAKKKPAERTAAKWRSGKKHASAYRHKRAYAHKKHRKPRDAYAHGRKHRAYAAEVVYADRRCDCRCGRVFQKPRKRRHALWHASAPRHVYTERAYRVRPLKHRRGGLTYRYGRHYIR